jgi:hypothetical protein
VSVTETPERLHASVPSGATGWTPDETKASLKTTEFWAMAGVIVRS